MEMMLEQESPFTRASLRAAIASRFGAEARFHTCSASEMDADVLIDFLARRGKFIDSESGFQTRADKICNHG
jgi:probable metal-binding protein